MKTRISSTRSSAKKKIEECTESMILLDPRCRSVSPLSDSLLRKHWCWTSHSGSYSHSHPYGVGSSARAHGSLDWEGEKLVTQTGHLQKWAQTEKRKQNEINYEILTANTMDGPRSTMASQLQPAGFASTTTSEMVHSSFDVSSCARGERIGGGSSLHGEVE